MKKLSLIKGLVVVLVSLALVASLGSVVFADDNTFADDWVSNVTEVNSTGTTTDGTTTPATGTTGTTDTTGTTTDGIGNTSTDNTSTLSTGNATTTLNTSLDNTNTEDNNNSVNSLAYTGLESNTALAIVVVLGVIVAAYSFKKIKEYNNI